MPYFHPGVGWFFWPHFLAAGFFLLFWLAFLGLLTWALLRLFSQRSAVGAPARAPSAGLSAIEILRQRYARGEIDADTFQQMLERLQAGAPIPPSGGPGQL